MRVSLKIVAAAFGVAFFAPSVIAIAPGVAYAQQQGAGAEAPVKQIALTDKQIESYLAAKKEVDGVAQTMPEGGSDQPDPKIMAKLDAVAKKYNFAGYADYDSVEANIGLVMEGVDPQTKKYVGAETMIKQEIAQVKSEKGMSPKDKKDALEQLTQELKSIQPVQFPGNIDLVTKNFDKISAAMPQEEEQKQ
jgi:hypothetical protein